MASSFLLHETSAGPAAKKAGEPKLGILIVFAVIVAIAIIGAIVLYAMDEDAAAQVILPVGTGLLGLLTGVYLGESSSK